MIIHKARKYELNPNKSQIQYFNKCCGCTRHIYNWGLDQNIKKYDETKKFINATELSRMLTLHKKEDEFAWLNEVPAISLFAVIQNLKNAFDKFYKKQSKFPKFKARGVHDSFVIARNKAEIEYVIKEVPNFIVIPKLGKIKLKEKYKEIGKPLNATVSRQADRWFVSIIYECEIVQPDIPNGEAIGIDIGLKNFAILSDGRKFDAPKPLNKNLKKLKRLQRRLSKKKKGSNNYNKQKTKIAKLHMHIQNVRKDNAHKLSTTLTKNYSLIALENLNIRGMIKNDKLSRHISDVAWGNFISMLEYKGAWYGAIIRKINRFEPSSKTCSKCGYILPELKLSTREWVCPECNTLHDRDINAAKNILKSANL